MYLNGGRYSYKSNLDVAGNLIYLIIITLLMIIMLFIYTYLTYSLVHIFVDSDLYSVEKIITLLPSMTASYLNVFDHDLNKRLPHLNRYVYLGYILTSESIYDLKILILWILAFNLTLYALNKFNVWINTP